MDVHGLFCRWIIMDCFPDYSKLSCLPQWLYASVSCSHPCCRGATSRVWSKSWVFVHQVGGKWIPVKYLVLLCISLVMSKVEPLSLFRVWSVSPTRLSAPSVKSFADLSGQTHGLEWFLGLLWALKQLLNGAMNGWMNEWICSALISYWNQA